MAYAFVQQNANDNASAATTITVTLTPTAGNLLVFCATAEAGDTASIALSDNLGSHNTFVQIGADLVSVLNQRCTWWYAENCKGGATTFTATFSAAARFRTIYVAEYSGIATTGAFLNGARAENANPGTGTDAVSSGNANATSQPALVWGFSLNVNGGTAPNAGTGFTSRTNVWSSATCRGRPEDKRVTATGNVAATWTATAGTDPHANGIGIFAEAAATPTVGSWEPEFPDRFPARRSVGALGVAVAPVLAIALTPLSWAPSFPDRAPARPIPNLATGTAVEPVFVPPAAPPMTPMSWSPAFPDFAPRVRAAQIAGGMAKPEATLPNAPAPPLSWSPEFPDIIPRPRAPLIAGGVIEPVAPNPVPPLASWAAAYTDSISRARAPRIQGGVSAPTLPIPDPPPSIFPLTVAGGRYLVQNDGTPFLICAQSVWELAVNLPLADLNTFLGDITSQGFNTVMSSAIEHNYTVVKPPKERGGNLPFTKRLDGATYTGSPNGTSSASGTHDQFAADNYGSPASQSPDPTEINSTYWAAVETVLDACLAHNVLVMVWPAYLGFHAGDEGWMSEMVQWNAVTGAGGFTGQPWADPTKSKMWNYGAWLANRWKAYPHIIWVAGGDYGTNTQTLSTPERNAVTQWIAGMKSVVGQASTLWTAHWDRPCISDDTTISGVTWDLNFCYSDEAVAEDCRRGYSTAAKPSLLGEYNYEDGLFGGSAPWRKYLYWGFLGGIAGGFFGNEPLWRVDTDYADHMDTQARQDATRQFALWKSLPWHRLKPNGLGGIGTLITAGGGTASPQSTTYVAAAATPEGDLLLAYVPPAHTGSVTIDMTKLGASVTARWFDPANATFTAIGTFPNTGTHAFTTPGNNSAGDADWLLVLEADPPMPLSWGPTFPDRAPRRSITTAEVVSGMVKPVAPPPPATLASWSPDFPDSARRARQPVNAGGMAKPEATLPDLPAPSWSPSFPDLLPRHVPRPHGGAVAPPSDASAGPLTWSPSFPDRIPGAARAPAGGVTAPPPDTNAGPLTWLPRAPDLIGRPRVHPPGGESAPLLTIASPAPPLSWSPGFPDQLTPRAGRHLAAGAVAPPIDTNAGPLTWACSYPDRVAARPRATEGGVAAPLYDVTAAQLSWQPAPAIPAPRPKQPIVGGEVAPVLVPSPAPQVPPLSWAPVYPDLSPRARAAPLIGGAANPEATLPNEPSPLLAWAPSFPDHAARVRAAVLVGGTAAPDATLPNPPAPPLSWSPTFPDSAPRLLGAVIVGGATLPHATLPNPAPPAPELPKHVRLLNRAPAVVVAAAPTVLIANEPIAVTVTSTEVTQ